MKIEDIVIIFETMMVCGCSSETEREALKSAIDILEGLENA